MGKTKTMLENEIDFDFENRYNDLLEYEEWLRTDGYIQHVNQELEDTKIKYSVSDIVLATRYASNSITLDPSEVGKEIYDILFTEKIQEFLTRYVND